MPETAAEPAVDRPLEHALEAALDELEPEGRRLVEWFYFERRTQQEIAADLGVTVKSVAGRLDRLRDKLRQRIVRELKNEP
ncbi:MAG: sigma-70 family RNA polymerase sigma factor [Verrucomicrobia bacterium]|nr:sigma-70 family RNA polymerase sigma factor [Verrucomicrobiota bacterium]